MFKAGMLRTLNTIKFWKKSEQFNSGDKVNKENRPSIMSSISFDQNVNGKKRLFLFSSLFMQVP